MIGKIITIKDESSTYEIIDKIRVASMQGSSKDAYFCQDKWGNPRVIEVHQITKIVPNHI